MFAKETRSATIQFPMIQLTRVWQFADDLSDFVDELERLAEEAKENARAETLKRRIERYVVCLFTPGGTHPPSIAFGRNSLKKVGMKRSRLTSQSTKRTFWQSKGYG